MYYIINRRGQYLIRDVLPAAWGTAEFAIGYRLHDEAKRVIKRLWPTTAKAVVWEAR